MKYILLFFAVFTLAFSQSSQAAPFRFLPTTLTQPDGTVLSLYASGDEYYHWVHDTNGYTVLQASDGYFYYAKKKSDGKLIPSDIKVGKEIPSENQEITKWLKIEENEYLEKRERMGSLISAEPLLKKNTLRTTSSNNLDTLQNIVIYISFPDALDFINPRSYYNQRLNDENRQSLKNYYLEASYNKFVIHSTNFPYSATEESLSYTADNSRGYYREYNATTNPIGYQGEDQRAGREQNLLANSISALKTSIESHFTAEQLDMNNDGLVDNICFIIQGNSDGWSSLLWAHRWSLTMYDIYLHDKKVLDFVFQPENQMQVRTLCHEMFHALGAPDLYHYSSDPKISALVPVGEWDIMESGNGHMSSYLKYKYGNFIEEIPEIKVAGTYSLKPLISGKDNVCYKVASTNPNEFYVIEYRKKEGLYENSLPGSGLLVYRINTRYSGNAYGPPDGVYLYRPNGTLTENGFPAQAYYTSDVQRASIGGTVSLLTTFLSDGSDGELRIRNVSSAGETISFDLTRLVVTGKADIAPENNFLVHSKDGLLTISQLYTGALVNIYNSVGSLVYSKYSKDETMQIALPRKNFYLVKVDSATKKVIH